MTYPGNGIGSVHEITSCFAQTRVKDDWLVQIFLESLPTKEHSTVQVNERISNEEALVVKDKRRKFVEAVQGLEAVSELYKKLPNATVDVRSLTFSMSEMQWFNTFFKDETNKTGLVMTLPECIACVAAFETGRVNLRPDQLCNVMAMSCGDSIYVSESLMQDPASDRESYPLRRVAGNIGRAGVAFLVPPQKPMIKHCDDKDWHLVNHYEFDGKSTDNFTSTSLHLSFTKAEFPIDSGFSGGQDVEAFLLESVISVHDRGVWVADINILQALGSPKFYLEHSVCSCQRLDSHTQPPSDTDAREYQDDTEGPSISQSLDMTLQDDEKTQQSKTGDFSTTEASPAVPATSPLQVIVQDEPPTITALDNWDELLLAPTNTSIVRAHGNWQARLAATAVCISRGRSTFILTSNPCWDCVTREETPRMKFSEPRIMIM